MKIRKYLKKHRWVKILTRDIPFIRNAIIIDSYIKGYKKDIGWNYNPGVSIFKKGIANIYRPEQGLKYNCDKFLEIKNQKQFFKNLLKKVKLIKKKTLENINLCEKRLKLKKLTDKELLDIFKKLFLSLKDFWNLQYFPMGLEISLNKFNKQDVILKSKKYLVAIRGQTQYITVKMEDLIDIVLEKISKSKRISKDLIIYSSPYELINDVIDEKILKERKRICIQGAKNKKYFIYQGKKAKEMVKLVERAEKNLNIKEIKGNSAYLGRVKGTVRVILYRKDIKNLKRGEIIVAPMTEAFYTPHLNKVKAIITDEGGITCHAAIISRELKIPCIVGTKIATRVLKDGDLVEVDAERGIVRILESNA